MIGELARLLYWGGLDVFALIRDAIEWLRGAVYPVYGNA